MMKFCFQHTDDARKIGLNAQEFVRSQYRLDQIYTKLIEHFNLMK